MRQTLHDAEFFGCSIFVQLHQALAGKVEWSLEKASGKEKDA